MNNFDPRYTFISKGYDEALSRLTYAHLQNLSLLMLTGDIGSGKSFILRNLCSKFETESISSAIIVNPMYPPTEFLKAVAMEFGLDDVGSNKVDILRALVHFARENHFQKSKTYLIVDEAQTIEDPKTWEEIRMLLNYDEDGLSLFRIVMAGTPNFIERIKDIPSLWQRVEIKCSLEGLQEDETAPYLEHRLSVAGATKPIFDEEACQELFVQTGGIPRQVNILADLALLAACNEEADSVKSSHVTSASEESQSKEITETLEQYIGNSVSQVVHLSRCMEVPEKKNQVTFSSLDQATEAGYVPCLLCIKQ